MAKGTLYVIPTPIGNLGDITLRALEMFNHIEFLVCEDTRVAGKLISKYMKMDLISKKPEYLVYNDYNARGSWRKIIDLIESGSNVGIISDAGTPTISDPGYRLIRGAYNAKIKVEVLPGASSVTVALTVSGLGGEHFLFTGFLPKKAGKRRKEIKKIITTMELFGDCRIVILITPHRLEKDLVALSELINPDTQTVLLRELTKKFEERIEGTLSNLLELSKVKKFKGELILVLANAQELEKRSSSHN